MKASATLFALLLAAQVLPGTCGLAHAQTADASAASREDESDGRKLQLEYGSAYGYDFKIPPYTVDQVTDSTKTLADGNQIRKREVVNRIQDQHGRLRLAYQTTAGKERILIVDARAKAGYLIRPERRDVLRVSGEPARYRVYTPLTARTIVMSWAREVRTNLGSKDFEGHKTAGTLTETFFPAGSAGNERELVETSEVWRSGEYALYTYQRRYTALGGEAITRLENFKAGEVADALFKIPADYTVRDIVFNAAPPGP
ncbi:hypothetical protein ACLB1G_01780 [Oxalobacteraceae bacterium A2-2]